MEQHWRNLIARYGAWPVVWCAGGEANLPWYLASGFPYDDRKQAQGWTEIVRYIRQTDPFRRPLTIHPTAINFYTARHAIDEPTLLDFDMLQTPHGQREAVPITVKAVRDSLAAAPIMPVIDGEASYERLSDSLPTEWTRAMFWLCLMNGAKGHTYGANGIWQLNRKGKPHGASPHGGSYGVIAWDEAMRLPGSAQVGYGKKFFEALPWTRLQPMPNTVAWESAATPVTPGDWIWYPEGDPKTDAPVAARYFRRLFEVPDPGKVRRAEITLSADDRFTLWINGRKIGSGASWVNFAHFDVTTALRKGSNLIAIEAENSKAPVTLNPAGLTAALEIEYADGAHQSLRTDAQWQASREGPTGWNTLAFAAKDWPAALVTAVFGGAPWGRPAAEDPLFTPQSCGIGDSLRAVYVLAPRPVVLHGLRPNAAYRLTYFDPVTGRRSSQQRLAVDARGDGHALSPRTDHDYVLLLTLSNTKGP